ncbi:MAG: LPS-assembly protein LptD, partial [Neisseriaceae bacterium]
MHKFNKILILLVVIYINDAYANNISTSNNGLNDLIKTSPNFPGCGIKDTSWQEQAGDDFVPNPVLPESALYLQADSVTGQESGVHYVSGNVVAYKDDKTLTADWLIYNQNNSRAIGSNIVLTRQYNVMTGQWADYFFDLNSGVIEEASAKDNTTEMYVEGKKIKIYNKYRYKAESGFFTSCDPKNPAWHFTSQSTSVDYQDSQGVARHATFYVESLPILYTPYFHFPLGKRKSGFLLPEIGGLGYSAGGTNYFVGTPFYWNMAPNYDMTIEPKIYSISGFMLTDQFRYLTENGNGEIYTEQLPNSWATGKYRYYWHLLDNHTLAKDWTVGYTFNSVSDNNYFVDFGNANSFVDNINLERSAFIRYQPYWGMFDIKTQGFQTLNPSGQPPSPPIYSMLPQINFNVNPTSVNNTFVKLGLNSQLTVFKSDILGGGVLDSTGNPATSLQDGTRLVFYPSITTPIQSAWG